MGGFLKLKWLILLSILRATSALNCYSCTDDFYGEDDWSRPYDKDCGDFNYHGDSTDDWPYPTNCGIVIWESGHTSRLMVTASDAEDGDCFYFDDFTECVCKGDLCNTESWCSQCGYPRPTPERPTTTTEVPTEKLTCFNCVNCPDVDDDTQVVEDEFLSCVTTLVLNSAIVIRGGSFDEYIDGECAQLNGTLSCYCSTDMCNDIQMEL